MCAIGQRLSGSGKLPSGGKQADNNSEPRHLVSRALYLRDFESCATLFVIVIGLFPPDTQARLRVFVRSSCPTLEEHKKQP